MKFATGRVGSGITNYQRVVEQAKSEARRPFLIHGMLQAYFDEAWDEKTRRDRDGCNRTEDLRLYRSKQWWESVMHIPYYTRKWLGWTHSRPGAPLRQWEDTLVDLKGGNWREWRDSFVSKQGWRRHTHALICELCESWELPHPMQPRSSTLARGGPESLKPTVWPTGEPAHQNDKNWTHGGERFVFVTDS